MATFPIDAALREQGRAAVSWLAGPAGRPIVAAAALGLAGLIAFTLYEAVALGLPVAREEPARFDLYHAGRSFFALIVSGLLVAALVRARARPSSLGVESCSLAPMILAGLALAAGCAATALFAVDPAAFHAHAQEDRPLEWASAGLLAAAGALFAFAALRQFLAKARRNWPALVLGGGLAAVLLVMAMEEISWGQRLFGFATPETLAEMNWQGEFNFHNIQTDLSELVYYAGAAIFLGLLPLLRDLVPPAAAAHPLFAFVPRRGVALVGAPLVWFNYGHWNLLPVQLGTMLALFALLAFARGAARRGDQIEQTLFLLAATAAVGGQALFLAFGPWMIELPDATEYKEFFIALGFAWYALTATRRAARA